MDPIPEIQLTANSLFHALQSALRELAVRGAHDCEPYIVVLKEARRGERETWD
jgi:hypothetical protein